VNSGLPIDAALPALREALRTHRAAVLQAPPGAGKSTVVPLALLGEDWARGRRLLMLEPRRLAARTIAARMAHTLGESVGATVGYRMRLDTRISRATRVEVITEGVLTRLLQDDPALEGVAAVIFDEFHERSLQADLGLALTLDARALLSLQLRILVMSATLEGAAVARLIGDAPLISAPGRAFALETRYAGSGLPLLPAPPAVARSPHAPERLVAQLVRRALREEHGDVLVFLPGAAEIRRVRSLLAGADVGAGVQILPLYGELSGEQQDAALAPAVHGTRKVVLATNIAETSLTIPGVRVVVDSGLVRRARFDPVTGMSRLETQRISRASAEQRAGRAARIQEGVCYRAWSEGAHGSLAAFTAPEIADADLAPLALELASWGAREAAQLRCSRARASCCNALARWTAMAVSAPTGARWRGSACTRAWRTCCCVPARSARCRSQRSWQRSCRSAICCAAAPALATRMCARGSKSCVVSTLSRDPSARRCNARAARRVISGGSCGRTVYAPGRRRLVRHRPRGTRMRDCCSPSPIPTASVAAEPAASRATPSPMAAVPLSRRRSRWRDAS
jgi:ATP-dependent helicase HrpB